MLFELARKAFDDNLTGLSGMVAYNLLLSVFPLALLALFIAGRVLQSADLEQSVLEDLRQLFPTATDDADARSTACATRSTGSASSRWSRASGSALRSGARSTPPSAASTTCAAAAGWSRSASRSRCWWWCCCSWRRPWRCPTLQSVLASGAEDLPFGLSDVDGLVYAVTLVAGLLLLFGVLCVIYWAVPNRLVPWRAIWPGALARPWRSASWTTSSPPTCRTISTIAAVRHDVRLRPDRADLVLRARDHHPLGGAILNAMRFELHETGDLDDRDTT